VQLWQITDVQVPSMPVIFIDAHTGDELWRYDNLQTYSLSDSDKTTYDLNTGTNYSQAVVGTDSDGELLMTHDSIGTSLAFLLSSVGRDSFNGSGAVVKSYGHYSNNYVNAFWDGSKLTFGDGDNYYSTYLGVLDVAAHELGHGVTSYEANLTYSGESGALNEASSDIMAAAVEAYDDGAVNSDTWDIGEDCWIEPGYPALRFMSHPSDDGSSRDHYSNRYTGSQDNGGVHCNSGIANHFFYLLSQGGQHHNPAYRTGNTVAGIGIDAAYKIWYRALSVYMTSSTNYAGARTATESACADLYSAGTCASVGAAWAEVGVGGGGAPPPTGCPAGYSEITGTLSGTGDADTYTYSMFTGTHDFILHGPSNADFDLYVYRNNALKASSTSSSSEEEIHYVGSANKVRVTSYSGSGGYTLCYNL
jgi:vibriolysin